MDSLTQVALGAAVGHTVLGRQLGKVAPIWGAALGTLPDLDVLIPYGGVVEDFTYHRGFSHSLFVHLLAVPLLTWLALKIHPSSREHKWRWAFAILAILWTHAFLDAFTVYGTQLFWPFTEYPFGISSVFIIDPLYTLPLLIGLGIAAYIGWSENNGIRATSIALLVSSAYLGWSLISKSWIQQTVDKTINHHGIAATAVLTTPTPLNTLVWRVVILEQDHYLVGHIAPWDEPEKVDLRRYAKGEELLSGLESEWNVQRLQWFTKGFYKAALREGQVVMTDLRMGFEGSYVFNFAIATETSSGGLAPREAIQIQDQMDIKRLPLVWDRIWSPLVSLHPETHHRHGSLPSTRIRAE